MTFSRTLRLLQILTLFGVTAPAFAQDPTSLSISPGAIYQPPGNPYCYTITVGNGAYMVADIKYRLNSGAEQLIENWPDLDGSGQRYVCTDSGTALGVYTFTAVRRHGSASWLPVNASLSVSRAPGQPASLTFNGSASASGHAGNDSYVLHAGGAAGMIIDLDYTVNGAARPPATLTLTANGDWNYTLSHFDEQGIWNFRRMKNHLRSDWVDINSTYTILPPKPTSASVSPASVAAGQGAYVWTVGNGANAALDIQYTLTSNGIEGPLQRINGWPQLGPGAGADGAASIPVGACAALGAYRFKWIKNTYNPDSTAITVNTAVTVTAPAAPVVSNIVPAAAMPGSSGLLTISGANLCGVVLSTTYPGISFATIPDDPSSTGTGVQTTLTVAANAQPGVTTIFVTARGGTTSFSFHVTNSAPPTITAISPAGAGSGDTQVTLTGTNLIGGMLSTSVSGLLFSNYTYNNQGTTLGARFTVSPGTPAGIATVTVNTPAGSASKPFTITSGSSGISSSKEYIYLGDRPLAVESASSQPAPPTPPAQLTGQALSPYTVQLQWQPATVAPGMAISSYQIRRGATVIASVGPSQLSYLDTSAYQNTAYTYRAVAQDNWPQTSADSNSAPVTTPRETVPPTVPANLYAPGFGETWVELEWNASTDSGGSGLAGYYVYFTGSVDPISALINATSFVIDFTAWGEVDWSYYSGFDVRAVDNAGNFSQAAHWQ